MKSPAITRGRTRASRPSERGVTMLLVAVAMVAIIAMAALSIDVTTLYLAREEAQRSADAAALAAARVISVSGITGTANPATDTSSWQQICGGATSGASLTAQAVAQQNAVAGIVPTVTVSYSSGSGAGATTNADCSGLPQVFAVNPVVTVKVTRTGLPTLFSRIWSRNTNSVSASATAEAFNPSYSASYGNGVTGTIIPVQPRCVKPWVVPNLDPLDPAHPGCTTNCAKFVDPITGAIQRPGISLSGAGANGVIGETFWMVPDCNHGNPNNCVPLGPPQANSSAAGSFGEGPPNLLGLPGQVGTPTAVPSCTGGDPYEDAVAGCDDPSNYKCGVPLANAVDLTKHNPGVNSITDAVQCLIHQTDATNWTSSSGQDYLSQTPLGAPSAYPFQIFAGGSNPIGASFAGAPITNSNSIVSLPIYDQIAVPSPPGNQITPVTFIGFLQVFINAVDVNGNRLVTVLNVSGCGNGTNATGTPVTGSSPVPVRLITAP
jgi:Flp pilus assembly protein TadG